MSSPLSQNFTPGLHPHRLFRGGVRGAGIFLHRRPVYQKEIYFRQPY